LFEHFCEFCRRPRKEGVAILIEILRWGIDEDLQVGVMWGAGMEVQAVEEVAIRSQESRFA